MFAWFTRRRLEKRRRIFRFWDGTRTRAIDPLQAYYALQEHPTFNQDVHCKLVDAGDPEATRIATEAVRDVFGVQAYDADKRVGLTVGETLGVLLDFYGYLEEQKKSTVPSPISPSSTEEASTSSSSATETTRPMLDSGPVAAAPTSDAPTPPA